MTEPEPKQKTKPKGKDKKTGEGFAPVEIPVPKRGDVMRDLAKVAPSAKQLPGKARPRDER
ncbi:MAG: hypothetical protein M3355_11975 [Actinomycetota bacterium]|nr:hypothetical protein [Actinomycetota bacterium]